MSHIRSQPFIHGSTPSPLSGGSSNHGSLVQGDRRSQQEISADYLMDTSAQGIITFGHNGKMLMNAPTFNIFHQTASLNGADSYMETTYRSPRIGNRQFQAQSRGKYVRGLSEAMKLLYERSAPAAGFNSKERFAAPKCHEKTRIGLLNMIHNWVNGYSTVIDAFDPHMPPFMWLYGPVGTGKSAIAQTTSEDLSRLNNLAASFFFSRTAPAESHRGDEICFVTTLAYQLTEAIPNLRPYVEQAIESRMSVFDLTLSEQVMVLIMEPLSHLKRECGDHDLSSIFAKVIVVDGLDEGRTGDGQKQVLEAIATLVGHPEIFQFSVFLASRPEVAIRLWIDEKQSKHPHFIQSTSLVAHCDSDADIAIVVNNEAAEIRQSHPFRSSIPADWPLPMIVKEIVKRASGQFIYAATVMKYVKDPRDHPTCRLENLLQNTIPNLHTPYADLDTLYLHILKQAEYPADVHQLLAFRIISIGFWDLGPPMSESYHPNIAPFLRDFLSLPCAVEALLIDMQSVICFSNHSLAFASPNFGDIVQRGESVLGVTIPSLFYHSSFLEFLLDPRRSGVFYIDREEFDKRFTKMALQQLKDSNPKPANENHIINCFLVALQAQTSQHPPYLDQLSTQLSRWDTLHNMVVYDVLQRAEPFRQKINRNLWKALAPAVMRKWVHRQQLAPRALKDAGCPQELLDLLFYASTGNDYLDGADSDDETYGKESKSLMWEMLTSAQETKYRGVNPWKVYHCRDDLEELDIFYGDLENTVNTLHNSLDTAEKGVLEFDRWYMSFLSEKAAAAVFYIKHVTSLLDPTQEAQKPPEMRAYFGVLAKIAGKDWRAIAACDYLTQFSEFIWDCCPLSVDIISALKDLCNCLFSPDIVSSVECATFPRDLANPGTKTMFLSSVFCHCALPRWYVTPAGFCQTAHSRCRWNLGVLHDYIHLYHAWNTQKSADRNSSGGDGEDNMRGSWHCSANTVDIDISVISAKELSEAIKHNKLGLSQNQINWEEVRSKIYDYKIMYEHYEGLTTD